MPTGEFERLWTGPFSALMTLPQFRSENKLALHLSFTSKMPLIGAFSLRPGVYRANSTDGSD